MKVATLITVIGNNAYELMASLCTPEKPATKTYTELVALMKVHLNPRPSMLAERFKFRQRLQKHGESIATYVSELKKLSKDCWFTAESLKDNLRDQFVCGLVNDVIRQRLFAEDDDSITFDRAFKMAVAMEAAEANAALVTGAVSSVSVHRVEHAGSRRPTMAANGGSCVLRGSAMGARGDAGVATSSGGSSAGKKFSTAKFRRPGFDMREKSKSGCEGCGGNHNSATCKFKVYVCRICNQEGHLKRMCPRLGKLNTFHSIEEQDSNVLDSK